MRAHFLFSIVGVTAWAKFRGIRMNGQKFKPEAICRYCSLIKTLQALRVFYLPAPVEISLSFSNLVLSVIAFIFIFSTFIVILMSSVFHEAVAMGKFKNEIEIYINWFLDDFLLESVRTVFVVDCLLVFCQVHVVHRFFCLSPTLWMGTVLDRRCFSHFERNGHFDFVVKSF